jgi:hypothetical protein
MSLSIETLTKVESLEMGKLAHRKHVGLVRTPHTQRFVKKVQVDTSASYDVANNILNRHTD